MTSLLRSIARTVFYFPEALGGEVDCRPAKGSLCLARSCLRLGRALWGLEAQNW